jgi:ABC-2 type transport system permease protein
MLRFYKAVFRIILARYLQYRAETCIWLVQLIIRPVLFLVVWSAAARTTGGQLAGYAPTDIAAYFIIGILVHHLVAAWPMLGWEERVKLGTLSYLMLRPVDVIHRDIGENITFKTLTTPVMALTAVALWFTFGASIHSSVWAVASAVPVILLGAVLYFVVAWTLAMAVFYTTQIDAMNTAFFFAMLLTSGQIAPLALMPPTLQAVAKWLPFWWYVGFPIEVILGHFTPIQVLQGIGMQVLWISGMSVVMMTVYRRGLHNYTAVGI